VEMETARKGLGQRFSQGQVAPEGGLGQEEEDLVVKGKEGFNRFLSPSLAGSQIRIPSPRAFSPSPAPFSVRTTSSIPLTYTAHPRLLS
jgi:hypothetical protein